jgi:cell division septal protein FtsQ
MLQRRRLKKERSKYRIRILFILLLFLSLFIVTVEYLYLNFSFGRVTFISPIAKINESKLVFLESALDKKKIAFLSASLNLDNSFTVELKEGGEIILSSKKDLESQLSSLQLILSRLTIEGKKLKKLDFRYDNPVVSF